MTTPLTGPFENWQRLSRSWISRISKKLLLISKLRNGTKLIIKTLLQALSRASKPTFLHSDMGSQYTSIAYEGLLKRHLIRHSYSKQGYPYDNGPLEAFHSLLKREFIFQTRFTSFEDLVLRVENYINWYNTERIRING
ncbi:DDE-type integrase/transposase/recombinase [Lentilactobacillus hilgardii]|nr:DDE-type integrase/transposase/recombinase [Lentilactobacillus hilgardii]